MTPDLWDNHCDNYLGCLKLVLLGLSLSMRTSVQGPLVVQKFLQFDCRVCSVAMQVAGRQCRRLHPALPGGGQANRHNQKMSAQNTTDNPSSTVLPQVC